mmetsp:Transcript_72944/g.194682  ORF Transcript_72944/g.194682 Transcript_72944/m.194682 type:complete len:229 (+) Transcript_72944:1819-2505(+)
MSTAISIDGSPSPHHVAVSTLQKLAESVERQGASHPLLLAASLRSAGQRHLLHLPPPEPHLPNLIRRHVAIPTHIKPFEQPACTHGVHADAHTCTHEFLLRNTPTLVLIEQLHHLLSVRVGHLQGADHRCPKISQQLGCKRVHFPQRYEPAGIDIDAPPEDTDLPVETDTATCMGEFVKRDLAVAGKVKSQAPRPDDVAKCCLHVLHEFLQLRPSFLLSLALRSLARL